MTKMPNRVVNKDTIATIEPNEYPGLIEHKRGHQHYGSIHESDDSCDNCDGARCRNCNSVWENALGEIYTSFEAACDAERDFRELIGVEDFLGFSIIDGRLHVLTWDNGTVFMPCNEESKLYNDKHSDAIKQTSKFEHCTCIDKTEPSCGNSCDVLKLCNSSACYIAMKNGTITTRLY